MDKSLIPLLAEVLDLYYDYHELMELAAIYDVDFGVDLYAGNKFRWLPVARQLVEQIDRGNHYAMLVSVLDAIEQRNMTAIARTDWERRDAHQAARGKVEKLMAVLKEPGIAREIVVAENKPFSAKAEIREFLERAETEIFVVDPYIGVGTLDCLRSARAPIRLLTGSHPNSIEDGFEKALAAFRGEGFQIEVRQHAKLHDRHVVFNERCWLIGSSLKDAGRKAFHTMEIVDFKSEVRATLEGKWAAGSPYPIPAAAAKP